MVNSISPHDKRIQFAIARVNAVSLPKILWGKACHFSSLITSHASSQLQLENPLLSVPREFYSEEAENFEVAATDFTRHVDTLLRNQANIRPITTEDMSTVMRNIHRKFNKFHVSR